MGRHERWASVAAFRREMRRDSLMTYLVDVNTDLSASPLLASALDALPGELSAHRLTVRPTRDRAARALASLGLCGTRGRHVLAIYVPPERRSGCPVAGVRARRSGSSSTGRLACSLGADGIISLRCDVVDVDGKRPFKGCQNG